MKKSNRHVSAHEIDAIAGAVWAGDRRALARAITLIESTRADHQARAQALLADILPKTGGALRIGISGAPGVGKSTFIEALGLHLVSTGARVAVLAVDPSSKRSHGSILGDKTRMSKLSRDERAFIRPSPAGGALGVGSDSHISVSPIEELRWLEYGQRLLGQPTKSAKERSHAHRA